MFYQVPVSFHKDHVEINDGHIDIGIMVKPVKGEANLEIIRKIAKHFKMPKSNVNIVAGEKSQDKVIEGYVLIYQTLKNKQIKFHLCTSLLL
jgi:uncharacterized protein YggU (UPF0235/DUF167 family)